MANQLSRVFDPKYDAHGRWWIMGLLFAAAGTASIAVGILCLTPGKPHIPTTGGPFYGLGIFLLLVGVFLLFVSLNDMLKVPWRRIFPAALFDHCYDFERIMFPNLPKSDASIMACILVMVLVAVALLVVGIILSISIKPFSHVKDLWVGIVFIVVAFMLSLWVALMCTVIHRPFAEAPGGDTSLAGPYAVQRAGPYSEPGGAPNEAPAGPDSA